LACVDQCLDDGALGRSLDKKLSAIQAALDRGRIPVAINVLDAFIHQVQAQQGKHISTRCACVLVEYAEQLIILWQ